MMANNSLGCLPPVSWWPFLSYSAWLPWCYTRPTTIQYTTCYVDVILLGCEQSVRNDAVNARRLYSVNRPGHASRDDQSLRVGSVQIRFGILIWSACGEGITDRRCCFDLLKHARHLDWWDDSSLSHTVHDCHWRSALIEKLDAIAINGQNIKMSKTMLIEYRITEDRITWGEGFEVSTSKSFPRAEL